LILTPIGGPAI